MPLRMPRRAKNVWRASERGGCKVPKVLTRPWRGPGVLIVNFATGFLEVRETPTHLRVGPSQRTDRPALASQDVISSQEGRTNTVRPSCVAVLARAEVGHQACGTSFSSATLKAR